MGEANSKEVALIKSGKTDELIICNKRIRNISKKMYNLQDTRKWECSNNFISGLSPEISMLKNLSVVSLSSNEFTSFPLELTALSSLKILNLGFNRISHIPPQVSCLTQLEELLLNYNEIRTLPAEFGCLTNLKKLDISNNFIEELPSQFVALKSLTIIQANHNLFTAFPTGLCSLLLLEELYFTANRITTISPEIGALANLKILDLDKNRITCFPPKNMCAPYLHNLQSLDLLGNEISEISPSIQRLTSLRAVCLRRNLLSSLPNEISSLTNIQLLDVSLNAPDFNIPNELRSLASLKEVRLSTNQPETPTKANESETQFVCVADPPPADDDILGQHAKHLERQSVWSGDGNVCVHTEIKKVLLSISEIRPGLFLSSRYAAEDRAGLLERGITHILIVATELEPLFPNEFEYLTIKARDNCYLEDLALHFPLAQKFIDTGRKKGGVLVHCAAGVSRSASVVMAYLMWSEKITFRKARTDVAKARPIVKPNFWIQLQIYSDFLKKQRARDEKLKKKETPEALPVGRRSPRIFARKVVIVK